MTNEFVGQKQQKQYNQIQRIPRVTLEVIFQTSVKYVRTLIILYKKKKSAF